MRGNGVRARSRLLRTSIAVGVLLSVAASFAIATRWLLLGSLEGRWVYGYEYGASATVRLFLIVALVSVVSAALLRITLPHPTKPRRDWTLIVVWLGAALALQAALRSGAPFSLERLFVSDTANSFYGFSLQYDAGDLLNRFNRISAQAPWHARGNMPGKVMLVYALRALTDRPDILPWLVVMVSNLGAVLIYVFVRDLFEDRSAALYAAVLYLFVPAKLLFFPLMNTVTPVLVLACACILLRWLATGGTWWALLLGAALYGLVFFEPLPLVAGLLFVALSLRAIALGQISWTHYFGQAAIVAIAFVTTAEAVHLSTNFDLFAAFTRISTHAAEFNATEARPYKVWVLANLEEFLFGAGLCQAAAFAGALVFALRQRGGWRNSLVQPIATVVVGLLAVLIAVDLIGINRGEVIRLWIFLACLFQIPAAYVCSKFKGPGAISLIVATSALQVAVATTMVRFVVP